MTGDLALSIFGLATTLQYALQASAYELPYRLLLGCYVA